MVKYKEILTINYRRVHHKRLDNTYKQVNGNDNGKKHLKSISDDEGREMYIF